MYVFDAIMSRRSVRNFQKKPVEDRLIGVLLFMASQAPSSGNVQEWEFIVVKDEEQKKKLAKYALNQKFIANAPAVIVICANLNKASLKFGTRGETMYALQDTAMAAQNIMLAAEGLGLGSCFVGAFEEDMISSVVELPDTMRPVAIIPIGYPAEETESPGRIPFENITSVEKFGKRLKLANLQLETKMNEGNLEPLSVYLEMAFKKVLKEKEKVEPKAKKLTFEDFLKMMVR
jgi:nitroreductase